MPLRIADRSAAIVALLPARRRRASALTVSAPDRARIDHSGKAALTPLASLAGPAPHPRREGSLAAGEEWRDRASEAAWRACRPRAPLPGKPSSPRMGSGGLGVRVSPVMLRPRGD